MNRAILLLTVVLTTAFFASSCRQKEQEAAQIPVTEVNYQQLKPVFTQNNDTLYVVNFWATWCGPCVQELPYFMEVNEKFRNKKFQMVLVSLDNPDKLEESVMDFVNRFGLDRARLYMLNDVKNMNEWIPDVDSSWGGTIPATLIIKNKTNLWFAAEALTLEELTKQIEQFI